ncbi:Hypothetical predicted protein [Mytilus galloprovincialis]|uniref:Uncharacterized protein n=1 Tax=Mytilus galloprovincialis TaxID=29158 RepID=A0A8B6CS40_MYTGA|nr:Hypothetical predicted protein [Mytilus galloprovincialis]
MEGMFSIKLLEFDHQQKQSTELQMNRFQNELLVNDDYKFQRKSCQAEDSRRNSTYMLQTDVYHKILRAQARAERKTKAEKAKKKRPTLYSRPTSTSSGNDTNGKASGRPRVCYKCYKPGH